MKLLNRKRSLTLALAVLLAAMHHGHAKEASFNFEISKRTSNTIKQFMSVPHIPNILTASGLKTGLLNYDRKEQMRENFFSQLKSFPKIYMIYAGFDTGYFSGYFRKTSDPLTYQYTQRNEGDNETASPRLYWWNDMTTGRVQHEKGIQRTRIYDPRARGWYVEAKAANKRVWSSVYAFASSGQLGLTACEPLINETTGTSYGVLAVDYELGDIDTFLTKEFSGEGRAVFLVEKKTGYLTGSSTSSPLLVAGTSNRIKATESTDLLVKTTATYMTSINWPEGLRVHSGKYIQVVGYSDPEGLDWYIVVVMPSSQENDFVVAGSTFEATIIAMTMVGALFPLSAGIMVACGRKKVIWKAAQPSFLIMFALTSFLIPLLQLFFLGPNTAESCGIRPWVFNIGFTLMFSTLFVKVHRVSLIFNNTSMAKIKMGPVQMATRVAIILSIEALIQLLWSLVDPNRPMIVTSVGSQGEYVESIMCASTSSAFSLITVVFKGAMVFWGCVLAWKTRNIHGAFAESKALMLTMYNIGFVGIVVLCLYNFLDVNGPTKVLVQTFGVLWVTVVSTMLVYGPRSFQLIMKGDIDMKEVMRQQTMMTSSGVTSSGDDSVKDNTIQKQLKEIQAMKEEVTQLQEKLNDARQMVKTMDIERGQPGEN